MDPGYRPEWVMCLLAAAMGGPQMEFYCSTRIWGGWPLLMALVEVSVDGAMVGCDIGRRSFNVADRPGVVALLKIWMARSVVYPDPFGWMVVVANCVTTTSCGSMTAVVTKRSNGEFIFPDSTIEFDSEMQTIDKDLMQTDVVV